MAATWHKPPRAGTGVYLRLNVWMLRSPWVFVLLVAGQLFLLFEQFSVWRLLMTTFSVVWLLLSFANRATRGGIERQLWPNIW